MVHYVLVCGGVISGLGKGVITSSLGVILNCCGMSVQIVKIDPYLNVDAGTLSPFEHGECFVTSDGGEVDLDLGNYYRFLGKEMKKENSITGGGIFQSIIEKERRGDYLGSTVQINPHFIDEVVGKIERISCGYDICLIELGGVIGDFESIPFVQAMLKLNKKYKFSCILVSYLPFLKVSNEIKTKPVQQSVELLRNSGLKIDVLILRCEKQIDDGIVQKIKSRCMIDDVIGCSDVKCIYKIPLMLWNKHTTIIRNTFECFNLKNNRVEFLSTLNTKFDRTVCVYIVGKYTQLSDAYLSLHHSLLHSAHFLNVCVDINLIDSENIKPSQIRKCDGIIIPGGFGPRGIGGMLTMIKYARMFNVPILGICLGMQLMVIESARNSGLKDANSTEFDLNTPNPVLIGGDDSVMGGTMNLGDKEVIFNDTSKIFSLRCHERHRHRYQINDKYNIEDFGLKVSGRLENGEIVVVEIENHPFFVGCQFHPEYKSTPYQPSHVLTAFLRGCF